MAWSYSVEIPSMEECGKDYPTLLKTVKKYLPELTDAQVLKVVGLVTDTCQSCFEADRGCQCWNDE